MNRAQKIECFNLFVTALSTGGSLGVVILLARLVGMPKAWAGMALMGLMGLMVLGPFIFRNEKGRDKVAFDERDNLIYERSLTVAHYVLWPFLVAACMIPCVILGTRGTIPVYVLPIILGGGGVIVTVVQSVAILVQYDWGDKGEKS